MPRKHKPPYNGAVLLAALISLAIGAFAGGCATAPIDLVTYRPCIGEDGPADGKPCVWDARRGPLQLHDPEWSWVLYADACPVKTIQDPATVRCIGRGDWAE